MQLSRRQRPRLRSQRLRLPTPDRCQRLSHQGLSQSACKRGRPLRSPPISEKARTSAPWKNTWLRSDDPITHQILSCLTDDVEWVIPGAFHLKGKDAFDKEIENPAFVGSPAITVTRLTEEGDVVVAEGSVRAARRDGGYLHAVFCDVFEMRDAKIRRLISYLMEVKEA